VLQRSATTGGGVPEAVVVAVVGRARIGACWAGRRHVKSCQAVGLRGERGTVEVEVVVVAKEAVSGRPRGAAAVLVNGVMAEHRATTKGFGGACWSRRAIFGRERRAQPRGAATASGLGLDWAGRWLARWPAGDGWILG
jgi:hypothetical protein